MRTPTPGFLGHLVTAVGGCALAAAIFLMFLSMGGGLHVGSSYTLQAVVPTSGSLIKGSRVTMAGAKVGQISGVRRRGVGTVVEMQITDKQVTPVPADSIVTLRQRTPVGENYVSITVGKSKRTVADGGTLPESQAGGYTDVDQILSVLRGSTRDHARTLIASLGEGLDGRGAQLNHLLDGATGVLVHGGNVLRSVAADREQVGQLVDRLGRLSDAVNERRATVKTVATEALTSLRAVAGRDVALRATLDRLPPTLAQVQKTTRKLTTASDIATPVVSNLAAAMRDVRPAVARLRPAAQDGREVVRSLSAAAPGLQRTMNQLDTLSPALSRALPQVKSTLCQLNPMLRYIEPYTKDVIAGIIGLGSASNAYDAIGHAIRLTPIIGENSLAGLPDNVSKAAYTLIHTGLLQKAHGLTWDPYPDPGKIGSDGAGRGKSVFGPAAVPATGYRFPHILADC
jgi:phospholipid/cholesterol/gamma-HCH transport system substrate-binding protein